MSVPGRTLAAASFGVTKPYLGAVGANFGAVGDTPATRGIKPGWSAGCGFAAAGFAKAGVATPNVATAGFGTAGFGTVGVATPSFATGLGTTGVATPGFATAGFGTAGFATAGFATTGFAMAGITETGLMFSTWLGGLPEGGTGLAGELAESGLIIACGAASRGLLLGSSTGAVTAARGRFRPPTWTAGVAGRMAKGRAGVTRPGRTGTKPGRGVTTGRSAATEEGVEPTPVAAPQDPVFSHCARYISRA